jgi:hypothetical protein
MDRPWQGSLARAGKFYVNQFESVSKAGSAKVLKALAGVLQVDMGVFMDRHSLAGGSFSNCPLVFAIGKPFK